MADSENEIFHGRKKSCKHINEMVHDSACDVLKLYMSTSYIFNQS